MPIILTEQMVVDAAKVATSLHESFIRVLELPNVQGRRAATLSNELGVGRMTCQRIVKLSKQNQDPPAPGSSPTCPVSMAFDSSLTHC